VPKRAEEVCCRSWPVLARVRHKEPRQRAAAGAKSLSCFLQTGVAISLFAKNGAEHVVRYAELWGNRKSKYDRLVATSATHMKWETLRPDVPYWFFRPQQIGLSAEYQSWPALKNAFGVGGCGIKTERDRVSVHWDITGVRSAVDDFRRLTEKELREKYDLPTDSRDWKVANAKSDVREHRSESCFRRILYRPFDVRHIWYSGQTRGFVGTPGYPTMRYLLDGRNLALLTCRQQAELGFRHVLCTRLIAECCAVSLKTREITSVFPLYANSDGGTLDLQNRQTPNFTGEFLQLLRTKLQLPGDSNGLPQGLAPEDIFHYTYGVFHSPEYRRRYAEFLKIDFPRLPLTGNLGLFRALTTLGEELVNLHLLESPKLGKPHTEFAGRRNPEVEKVTYSKNTVWIDKAQTVGFRSVHEEIWNFHIGGYQVCEKWLKDRKGRTLSQDDVAHYHKIVIALAETIRLMGEIDKVIEKHGGWPGAFSSTSNTAAPQRS
jgi:hypothetical protein